MKVGYLGPKNSFTHQAAKSCFPENQLTSYQTIAACIHSVYQEEITYGVIPIENSLEGSVNDSIDRLFHLGDLVVLGEIVLPIKQQLLVANQTTQIEKIHKHWRNRNNFYMSIIQLCQSKPFLPRRMLLNL